MSSGRYSTKKSDFDKTLDLTQLKPYGDTMNDGKVQLSFTLPVPDSEVAVEAARQLAMKMGLVEPTVSHASMDKSFSFFVVYGSLSHSIDYTQIHVEFVDVNLMTMDETDLFIQQNFGRKIRVIGASTGTDAHTVGIDAIMNMKGYAGHYGLERYKMIEALNLGSQVTNEDFIRRAVEFDADVLLVSQTVTQKNVHVQNLTELVELLEAERLRRRSASSNSTNSVRFWTWTFFCVTVCETSKTSASNSTALRIKSSFVTWLPRLSASIIL